MILTYLYNTILEIQVVVYFLVYEILYKKYNIVKISVNLEYTNT